jgi:hypothetical protein
LAVEKAASWPLEKSTGLFLEVNKPITLLAQSVAPVTPVTGKDVTMNNIYIGNKMMSIEAKND